MMLHHINVDEHPWIAEQLRISSLPTLIMIKDGKIVRRQSGVTNKSRLVAWMR
jgi:thioredoxin-like negative regulator of GroEL